MNDRGRYRLSDHRPGGDDNRGIRCPKCGCQHFHVLYTRADTDHRIKRRRECRNCGKRITTWEIGPAARPTSDA